MMGRWQTPQAADGGACPLAALPLRHRFAVPPPHSCGTGRDWPHNDDPARQRTGRKADRPPAGARTPGLEPGGGTAPRTSSRRRGRTQTSYQGAIISRVLSPRTVSLRTCAGVAAIHLGRRLPGGSSSQPGSLGAKHACLSARDPYSALLRVGFAMRLPLPAPRCALAAPFHPCLCPLGAIGGILSVALSLAALASDRRALPATLVSWSPDFPRILRHAAASGPLTGRPIGAHCQESKISASAPGRGRAGVATGSRPPRRRERR